MANFEKLYPQAFSPVQAMDVRCPDCEFLLHAGAVNISDGIAKCTSCENLFQLHHAVPRRQKPQLDLPTGLEIFRFEKELEIQFSWRQSISTTLLFFNLAWNAFWLIFAVAMLWVGGISFVLLIGIPIAIGIYLLYFLIAQVFNYTSILIDEKNLCITHKPLSLPGYDNKIIDRQQVDQVYIEKYIENNFEDGPEYAFAIYALHKQQKKLQLVKRIAHYEQAQFIEQALEDYLLIADRKIEGEYAP